MQDPHPSTLRRIAVFAAMPWECRPVLRQLRQVRRDKLGMFPIWRSTTAGVEVLLVKTGIGPQRAAAAANDVAASGSFDLFLSTGCAGGLSAHAAPGDVAIASFAVDAANDARYAADAYITEYVAAIARSADLTIHHGPILCVAHPLSTAAAKRDAAMQGHVAVEMEGAAIAAHAAAAHIPYISVRAILDGAETELLDGGFVNPSTGGIKPLALAKFLARRPRALGDLLAMQGMMQAAEQSLDRFFAAWFLALDGRPSIRCKPATTATQSE